MKKETLSSILLERLFVVPDYQRGYAWEIDQWTDFANDIDALVDEEVINHYTGTIVIYQKDNNPTENYGIEKLELVEVVDGQQRLTTSCLYLSVIINQLVSSGFSEYENKKQQYLYCGAKSKVRLNNEANDFFYDLMKTGNTNTVAITIHQKRLLDAYTFFKNHIVKNIEFHQDKNRYLQNIFDALTRKLNFTFYRIEKESEIGMTFELMNSRGKDLSILELLKNYLMHWIYRNMNQNNEQEDLTSIVNKSWKEVYSNISFSKGNEDQCLKIAWILYCTHTPKYWNGYRGFKDSSLIPLRDFSNKSKEDTKNFISIFTTGLAEISKHYSIVVSPTDSNTITNELLWLNKIHNAGNLSNYLPLIVASRINFQKGLITELQYINILKSLEIYSYRVFLFQGRRSNAGVSTLYRWAYEVFREKIDINMLPQHIYGLINWYSNETDFREKICSPSDWYYKRSLLRYTLFEYELELLRNEGKGKTPRLAWSDLTDATIEHILPQTPDERSHWKEVWSTDEISRYLHDIGNLVLTENNSNYRNFDFSRKKGFAGQGFSYSNSDIRQERKLSQYDDWTINQCIDRRNNILEWILQRWGISTPIVNEIIEEEDFE